MNRTSSLTTHTAVIIGHEEPLGVVQAVGVVVYLHLLTRSPQYPVIGYTWNFYRNSQEFFFILGPRA